MTQDATNQTGQSTTRITALREAVRGRLAAYYVTDLSDATLVRVLGETVCFEQCLQAAREMVAEGLTVADLHNEFGLITPEGPGEWPIWTEECEAWAVYRAEVEHDEAFSDSLGW